MDRTGRVISEHIVGTYNLEMGKNDTFSYSKILFLLIAHIFEFEFFFSIESMRHDWYGLLLDIGYL